MSLNNDNKYLATGGKTGLLKIWKIKTFEEEEDIKLNSSYDKKDINNSEKRLKDDLIFIDEIIFKIYWGHSSDITDISWSKKYSNLLVSLSLDQNAILYNINENSPIKIFYHKYKINSISFCPNFPLVKNNKKNLKEKKENDYFLISCINLTILLWNINNNKKPFSLINVKENISCMLFFPDGSRLCLGSNEGNIFIYEVKENFKYMYFLPINNSKKKFYGGYKIIDMIFINQNELIVSSNDNKIRIININNGNVLKKYKGHKNNEGMIKICYSKKSHLLVSSSEDKNIYLWQKKTNSFGSYSIILNKRPKTINNYEYFLPNYKEKKEFCTQCIFISKDIINNYNLKINKNSLNIIVKTIFILITNEGYLQVLIDYKNEEK